MLPPPSSAIGCGQLPALPGVIYLPLRCVGVGVCVGVTDRETQTEKRSGCGCLWQCYVSYEKEWVRRGEGSRE